MTTYNSTSFFTGDGATKVFNFGFSYISKEHIQVEVAGTLLTQDTDFSVTDGSITLVSAPATGVSIKIYRKTPTTSVVTWSDGSYLLAKNMTLEQTQSLYILQEQEDFIKINSIEDDGSGAFNGNGKQIKNVAGPTAQQDVVTKGYMESVSDGFVAENTAIQNDIKTRQTDVTTKQADVTTKQADVASMKTAIEGIQEDVTTRQVDVVSRQTDVTTKHEDVTSMKTTIEGIQEDVTTKQSNVTSMKITVEGIQEDVTTKQVDVTTRQADVTTRQADVTTRQADVVNMQTNISALQAKFNVPTQIFPGTILPWGSTVVPYGYLLCDGSAISRTTYSELFAQIGTTFGVGDGSTTFNLPDGQNRTMVGKGNLFASLGLNGGEKDHTLTEAELPIITPKGAITNTVSATYNDSTMSWGGSNILGDNGTAIGNTDTSRTASVTVNSTFNGTAFGSGNAHNNMPPYLVVNWIIKYTSVGKSNADKLYRQDSTVYTQGDVLLGAENLSKQYGLICTTTGTTGSSAPSSWSAVNNLTTDGTAQFVTRPATEMLPVIQVTGNTTLLFYQVASYVNCTGTTPLTVTMPTPASANGGAFVIRNATSVAVTLSTPSGNFIGPHGSQTGTLSIPTGVIVELYTGGSNWVVTTWENRLQNVLPTITGAITLTEQQMESVVVLSGTSTYTVTLPAPTTAGHTLLVRNAGSAAMTLSTPNGIFDGPNGSLMARMSLPAGVVCGLMSNGMNWVVERYTFDITKYYTKTEVDVLIDSDKNIYGSSFDGVNSAGTRLYASSGLSWSPSTDISAGTDQFTGKSVWNGFDVLVKYDSSTGKAKIVAYEGTSAFDTYKNDDSYGADVFHMFPKGYFRRIASDSVGAETKLVSTKEYANFTPSSMHYRGGVLHDYIGVTKYGWCDDGNNGICSRSGKPPKVNIPENQFETLSRAKGLLVGGINDVSWLQHIGSIKYNNLNWQSAVGQGIVNTYAKGTATVSESGVSRIIVSNAQAASFSVGTLVHISSAGSGYWWPISAIVTYDSNNMAITVTSGTTFNTTSGSTTIETSCFKSGGTDTILGQDGAVSVGSDEKRSILTMGIENFYGNTWKLLSGVCRIGSNIYINPSPDSQYAWPSSDSDALSKGWVKYGGTYQANSGYISTFGYDSNYPQILLPATASGTSVSPVGDYYYTNTDTNSKVVQFGGILVSGPYAGPFFANLGGDVGIANWNSGSLGVFIP